MLLQAKSAPNPSAQRVLFYVLLWDLMILGMAAVVEFKLSMLALPEPVANLFRLSGQDGLIPWSTLVSLFGVGAACVILGAKSRRIGWWLGGLSFVLLSIDQVALLSRRLGPLLSLQSVRSQPWLWALAPIVGMLGLFVIRRIWKDTEHTTGIRRGVLWAGGMWALSFVALAGIGPLEASDQGLLGLSMLSVARWLTQALALLAPLLFLYCVVSLIEYHERKARIKERSILIHQLRDDEFKRAA